MSVFESRAKINRLAAATRAVVGAGAWSQPAVAGSDLWWHLASGRDIWSQGAIPRLDPYSFTAAGAAWMNHEWLWDVVYWGFYRIHPQAVAWLHLAVLLAVFLGFSRSPGEPADHFPERSWPPGVRRRVPTGSSTSAPTSGRSAWSRSSC